VTQLPKGWAWTTLGQIGEITGGITKGQKRKSGVATRAVPYLRVANVQRGYLDLSVVKTIHATEDEIARLRLLPNDVLLNEGGDRDKLGRGWVWEGQLDECVHQNHVFRVRTDPAVAHPKLVSYYTNHFGQQHFFAEGKQTTNLASISLTKISTLPVPLPPLAEQRRILAEIERMLSLVESAVESLRHAKPLIERYCEARVSAAFNPLLSEHSLPLGILGRIVGGITKGQRRKAGARTRTVPYLRVANVQRCYLDLRDVKTIEATDQEIEALRLMHGDVLLNEGGDRDKLGRGWVWEDQLPECIHQNHVFRVRLDQQTTIPKYVSYFANHLGRQYFFDQGKQTTNLASISLRKVSGLPIPTPPVKRQIELVAALDDFISVIAHLNESVGQALARAAKIRQAILKAAFEGRLVPQDPTEEPASVLPERIRASRAAGPPGRSTRRPPKRKAPQTLAHPAG
jgi:type I restriction enzyme S subunit